MKKILIFVLLLFVAFMFGCSDVNENNDTTENNNETEKIKLEYKEYKSSASFFRFSSKVNNFYVVKSCEEFEELGVESILLYNDYYNSYSPDYFKSYDSEYYNSKGLICFEIMESSGDNVHSLDISLDNNIISIDYKQTSPDIGDTDIAFFLVLVEVELDKIDNIQRIIISGYKPSEYVKFTKVNKMVKITNEFEDGILHGKVNGSYGLSYVAAPMKYENGKFKKADVKWTSSDENVAIVSNMGHVHFIGGGNCVITINNDGVTDSIQVSVEEENILKKYAPYYDLLLSNNMKGLELYCYRREKSCKYDCVMLLGTNRLKTVDEIKDLQDRLPCPLYIMKELISYASDELKQKISITIVSNPPTVAEIQHETKLYENELEALYVYLELKEVDDDWVLNQFDLSGEKYIYSGDINANFTDDMIALTMMNTNSYPILTPSDFGIDDIVRIDYVFERPNDYMYKEGTAGRYTQIVFILVKPRGKEKIIEYIRELEKLPFVRSAEPNMLMEIDTFND